MLEHDEVRSARFWRWCKENPYFVPLCSGAFAGVASETLLFPLDCLKTRLQSRHGFIASGGFRSIYRGVFVAIGAAAPASAIFFSTYETTKTCLMPYDRSNSVLAYCGIGLVASILGELAAGVWRVPVDLVKQRQQAGGGQTLSSVFQGVRSTQTSIFVASLQASLMRDVTHSSLQFPMYEYLKLASANLHGVSKDALPTWQAASCGTVAGVVSAFLSTPLDVLRTRLNLREDQCTGAAKKKATHLVQEEAMLVYSERGFRGFFAGCTCRAAWMGLGGFIFLGSFELAKKSLVSTEEDGSRKQPQVSPTQAPGMLQPPTAEAEPVSAPGHRQLGLEPPAMVSFSSGLLAGVAVDVPLHPLDTLKTRMQSTDGFWASGGYRNLWSGLSAVLLVSLPGSALFFLIYESARHFVERRIPAAVHDNTLAIARDAVAASVADVSACIVRVPCEVLKQRMQALGPSGVSLSFSQTVTSVHAEGLRGFFAGFGATAMREVPFALIQMPLFEELKHHHPWARTSQEDGNNYRQGLIGMHCGSVAGGFAGVATTPLDAAKTRIMLTEDPGRRLGLWCTMRAICQENGMSGLFRGALPRALHSGLGGALWLGAFEWSKLLLWV
ncbi:slc25a26 [Symbiodinium sp. KB8]|nr:slc25a26 [Symbiodinium sp. KB8]